MFLELNLNDMKKLIIAIASFMILFMMCRKIYYNYETEPVKDEFISVYKKESLIDERNPLYGLWEQFSTRRRIHGDDYKLTIKKWRVRIRGNTGRIWVKNYVNFYKDGEVVYTIDYTNPGFVILIEKVNGSWNIIDTIVVP